MGKDEAGTYLREIRMAKLEARKQYLQENGERETPMQWTVEWCGEQIGVRQSTWTRWENGEGELGDHYKKVAKLMEIEEDELFNRLHDRRS